MIFFFNFGRGSLVHEDIMNRKREWRESGFRSVPGNPSPACSSSVVENITPHSEQMDNTWVLLLGFEKKKTWNFFLDPSF